MKFRAFPLLLSAAMVLTSLACASAGPAGGDAKPAKPALVGPVTREKVEEAVSEWVQVELESHPDAEAAQALASVEPGAEVTILLGTWCSDSRREVSRFWKALDETGGAVPFEVHYVAVDEDKKEPAAAVAENGVRYLPTFVVRRGGHEVGRIVETSPNGIEKDLLALLTGKAQGLLATREDLTSPAKPPL